MVIICLGMSVEVNRVCHDGEIALFTRTVSIFLSFFDASPCLNTLANAHRFDLSVFLRREPVLDHACERTPTTNKSSRPRAIADVFVAVHLRVWIGFAILFRTFCLALTHAVRVKMFRNRIEICVS